MVNAKWLHNSALQHKYLIIKSSNNSSAYNRVNDKL